MTTNENTSKNETLLAVGCGALLVPLLPLLGVVLSLWRAVFVVPLWRWYAVPLGLPEIRWLEAAGLCVLIGLLKPNVHCAHTDDREARDKVLAGVVSLLAPPMSLALGWLLMQMGTL